MSIFLTACSLTACSTSPPSPDLHRLFPAHAAEITEGAIVELPSDGLRGTLPPRGEDLIRLETSRGLTLTVRELGASGEAVLDGAALAYPRLPAGTSYWRTAGEGLEEWLLLPPGVTSAAWEMQGGTLHPAGRSIEIVDDAGIPRVRVMAPAAYAASGAPVQVHLEARGARIELFVDDAPSGEALLVDPTWTPTSAMSTAREGHTATLLADGHVLIAGGNGTQVEQSAELYDPATLTFSLTGTMADARVNHFAARLADGTVLCAGGDQLSSAEVYDPSTGVWSTVGSMSVVRTRAAGAVLPNGKVLLTGGDSSASATAEVYDPSTKAWTLAAPPGTPRTSHTATSLPDGRVLIAGGINQVTGKDATTASVEIYDPTSGTWADAAPLPQACAQHTATALSGGGVLVAGGTSEPSTDSLTELDDAARYDPVSNAWQAYPPMSTPRALHTATLLPNGAVLVAGGLDKSNSALRSAEMLDPSMLVWREVTAMTRDRISHTATALDGGTVLVAGGEQQSSAELFQNGQVGEGCKAAIECQSGSCVDGVCCATACALPCHSCALPGSAGTCTLAPTGTDPRNDCGDGGACDMTCGGGGGACVSRAGMPCTAGGCTSDGLGQFAAASCESGVRDCPIAPSLCADGYVCDADAGACRTDCGSLADCAPGYGCDPSLHCVVAPSAGEGPPSCAHGRGMEAAGAGGAAAALLAAIAGRARRKARRAT